MPSEKACLPRTLGRGGYSQGLKLAPINAEEDLKRLSVSTTFMVTLRRKEYSHGNRADTVIISTHAVTDPWSFSPCPPQRHEYAFSQGCPLPMQNEPPARNLRLDVARDLPPAFGAVLHRAVPPADVQALVLSPQGCELQCVMCPAKCGKSPTDHLQSELHLCP